MRILYVGGDCGTSGYRANAMRRLGHEVSIVDPWQFRPRLRGVQSWCHHTGSAIVAGVIASRLLARIAGRSFDLAWVDSGEFVSARLVRGLHAHAPLVINYNHDDPFGTRDGLRFRQYRAAVKEYDLVVVVRDCNIAEVREVGARRVLHVFRSADEVAHAPRRMTADDYRKWGSEVVFAGTWMRERGPFMQKLVEAGVPLSIFGDGWQRAREWPKIKTAWRGPAANAEEDYVRVIQCAKICLGLLAKENRDLHTTRSLEIPALGSLFLAERTSEHLLLYKEDEEAVFWADAEECARKCHALLADPQRIRRIAAAGQARALANGFFNEKVIAHILRVATAPDAQCRPVAPETGKSGDRA